MAEDAPKEESVTEPRAAGRSLDPHEVWEAMQRGDARLLDLRTVLERRRYGAPGARFGCRSRVTYSSPRLRHGRPLPARGALESDPAQRRRRGCRGLRRLATRGPPDRALTDRTPLRREGPPKRFSHQRASAGRGTVDDECDVASPAYSSSLPADAAASLAFARASFEQRVIRAAD
jgi:hypothetical protein